MNLFDECLRFRGIDEGPVRFIEVQLGEIEEAEERIHASFPSQLREFYKRVGYGWIASEANSEVNNLIIHPLDVADLCHGESAFSPEFRFSPGDLPFFDSGWSRFLVLRPHSANPNKVYRDDGNPVEGCSDFDGFVQCLLNDPVFYLVDN